jgi:hypothetical protein
MNPEILEHIESFLDGKINRNELQQQAANMGIADPELDQEISWLKDSRIAIEATGLRIQLQEALPQTQAPQARLKRLFSSPLILTVAAALALLFAVYFGFWNKQPSLYAKYEYVDAGLPVLMSQSEDYLLYDALTYFGEGNYAVAAEKLGAIEEAYAGSDTLAYYLGASYLYLGKTDLARPFLQKVSEKEASGFIQKAQWLLVLTELKDEDKAAAVARLSVILTTSGHEFAEPAAALAQELAP